jgi:hypothetical protein
MHCNNHLLIGGDEIDLHDGHIVFLCAWCVEKLWHDANDGPEESK